MESISKELTLIAKKPISHAMTIALLIGVYRAHLSDPCARDPFRQRISILDFLSPEEFEEVWDKQENK